MDRFYSVTIRWHRQDPDTIARISANGNFKDYERFRAVPHQVALSQVSNTAVGRAFLTGQPAIDDEQANPPFGDIGITSVVAVPTGKHTVLAHYKFADQARSA